MVGSAAVTDGPPSVCALHIYFSLPDVCMWARQLFGALHAPPSKLLSSSKSNLVSSFLLPGEGESLGSCALPFPYRTAVCLFSKSINGAGHAAPPTGQGAAAVWGCTVVKPQVSVPEWRRVEEARGCWSQRGERVEIPGSDRGGKRLNAGRGGDW